MGALHFKDGVELGPLTIAGAAILGALVATARPLPYDLTVTCGRDSHPPTDPHTLGNAFDVRSHDVPLIDKPKVLLTTLRTLQDIELTPGQVLEATSGGWATVYFFGWLEHANSPDEHFHFQLRRGRLFPSLGMVRNA